ncbi:MAG: hypothetical protein KIT16_22380, partial [Rhodospirillaceae bacterium]|nr:hypothetical protein [Rhodospirillaceae bacterium]
YEGCSFVKVLLEDGVDGTYGKAAARHLAHLRKFVEGLAAEAGIGDPPAFATGWYMLMEGAMVAALSGNRNAALDAHLIAERLLDDAK